MDALVMFHLKSVLKTSFFVYPLIEFLLFVLNFLQNLELSVKEHLALVCTDYHTSFCRSLAH